MAIATSGRSVGAVEASPRESRPEAQDGSGGWNRPQNGPVVARAEGVGDHAAHHRTQHPDDQRGDDAEMLLAGKKVPGHGSDHQTKDDKPIIGTHSLHL